MFKVGQKVVCVDNRDECTCVEKLVLGQVYTIAGFGVHEADLTEDAVFLVGVKRLFKNTDWPFGQYRFRPVVERKTDISVFTEMLTKLSETV